jgi:hydrogenase maturation protease
MSTLVIGVGNAFRRDDAAGIVVAERLSAAAPAGTEVVAHHGEGAELMEMWRGRNRVIVVDAVSSGAAPGAIHRFAAERDELPAHLFCFSSHAFGLAQAVALSRALGTLPAQLTVIGIEGADFGLGEGMSPAVIAAVETIVAELSNAEAARPI